MFLSRLFVALITVAPVAATAHEFWIEPLAYKVAAGEKLQAHFRNGQEFKGGKLAFFERSSDRFDLIVDGTAVPLLPRSGDSPALDIEAPGRDTLVTVVHDSSPSVITYREWEKFLKFAAHKDFAEAAADHTQNGWSKVKFRERYTRHVKALMAVGSGAGSDSAAGLKTEFVAQTNPYLPTFGGEMVVSVLYEGAPRAMVQVEVFERAADDNVTVTLHQTNADGIAKVQVKPGYEYLFDAVVLRPAPDATTEENAIVWETYWAALTFAVPLK